MPKSGLAGKISSAPQQVGPPAQLPGFEGQIVYTGEDGNLQVVFGDTGEAVAITQDASAERTYLSPRWSPDGQKLAYCQQDGGDSPTSALIVTRPGEWLPIVLARDVYCKNWPEGSFGWSPDSNHILFSYDAIRDPSLSRSIWSASLVDGVLSELIPAPGSNLLLHPKYSPDGKWVRLYEVLYLEGLGVLRTWNAASGTLYNWLQVGGDLFPGYSSWSPDGTSLVFDQVTYLGFRGAGLYVAAADGSNPQKIYADPNQVAVQPLWSPDGNQIAFQLSVIGASSTKAVRLMLVSPQGTNLQEVAAGDSSLTPLRWSENGNQLLYADEQADGIQLYLYDVASSSSQPLVRMSGWDVDWSKDPLLIDVVAKTEPQLISDFPYNSNMLVYLAGDYRLVLFDPSSGEHVDLSQPMTVAGFFTSPSRQRLLSSGRLFTLDFAEDGSLLVRQAALPAVPAGFEIHWSPDENRAAYRDRLGKIWIVGVDGSSLEVPGATSLPVWSADGSWLAYCTGEGSLTVAGPGAAPGVITAGVDCTASGSFAWSPGKNLLAYTVMGDDPPSSSQVYLYDPTSGTKTKLQEDALLDSWSPDGRLIAAKRVDRSPAPPGSITIFAIDPISGRQLAVGQFDSQSRGLASWLPLSSGAAQGVYFFGPYRLTASLDSVARTADEVFAAAAGSSQRLSGIGRRELVTLACEDSQGRDQVQLRTISLAGLGDNDQPGVWGQMSSDGAWAAIYAFDQGRRTNWLTNCDGQDQIALPETISVQDGAFSAGGDWYAWRDPAGGVILRDLSLGVTETITSAGTSSVFWLQPMSSGLPGINSLRGQVLASTGEPIAGISILLNGQPAAFTDANGAFTIAGLADGKYQVSPSSQEAGDWSFKPAERTVKLPPDTDGVDFTGQSTRPPTAAPQPSPTAFVELAPGESETTPSVSWLELVFSLLSASPLPFETTLGLLCAFPLLLLLGIIIFVRRRRRRKRVDQQEPKPESASRMRSGRPKGAQGTVEAPAASIADHSVEKPPSDEQLQGWLKLGAAQVKNGDTTLGSENLRMVLTYQPDNPRGWFWLGWAAAQERKWRAAERCFRQAKSLGHPKADKALAWLEKASREARK